MKIPPRKSSEKILAPIVDKIYETAARQPGKDALICGDEKISYLDLKAKIESAAFFFKSQGVRQGDRVVISAMSRRPSFVFGYFACHSIGAIAVPVEAGITEMTLERIVRQTRPRMVLLDVPEAYAIPAASVDLLGRGEGKSAALRRVSLDAVADILYTSGSTGRPKGVPQTHRNILAFANNRNAIVGCTAEDRLVLPVPLSHGFGLGRLRCGLLRGATVILVDGFRFPGNIFQAFNDHGASGFCCVPSGFAALFRSTNDELGIYRDQLEYIETATAPLPDEQKTRLIRLLPKTRIFNSYGMTETTSSIAFIDLNGASEKIASVGNVIPGVEIGIVDDRGRRVAPGELGRILIRGDNVMKGYWRDPVRTREAFVEGWYAANDLGMMDADGYLYLKGRKEELINVGGLKVAPIEIENVLNRHPAVRECACVGVEDPAGLTGEAVKVFLVPVPGLEIKPSPEEISRWLRGKVEYYKIPSQFIWLDELPKTTLGKIQRARLLTT